jgi:hypothetical protein
MVTNNSNALTVRVTRLESFRRWRDEGDTEIGETMFQELLRDIKSPPAPNRKMQLGTAFHTILATPYSHRLNADVYSADGFDYPASVVESAMAHIDYNGLFEVATGKVYNVGSAEILVTGTCDHWFGNVITDFKTRWFEGTAWGVWDDNKLRETYEASYQWRFYCDLFDADEFQYLIIAMRDRNPIELVHVKTDIVCHAYKRMRQDLDDLLSEFLHFVQICELQPYLKITEREERIIAAIAASPVSFTTLSTQDDHYNDHYPPSIQNDHD